MHSKHIIHRDIKPENIIFKGSGDTIDIGIVDLGFATFESEYRSLFVRCGTPGYVAPEVLNDKEYNCKADVFSAGIIFYMILTGAIPFNGTSYKQIVLKNMKGIVNFDFSKYNVKVSDETMDLLKKMLERDPEKRISSAEALGHNAFQKMLSKSPLIVKKAFNADALIQHMKLTEDQNLSLIKKKTGFEKIPDRIEDMSPLP